MESDNQNIIIKSVENEYVIDDKLKDAVKYIMLLNTSNDKKIKMLKYVLSINFDIKITNNHVIIDMLKALVGEEIIIEVMRDNFKRNQKKYYQTHKELFREKYREKAQMLKEYKEMKAKQQKEQ